MGNALILTLLTSLCLLGSLKALWTIRTRDEVSTVLDRLQVWRNTRENYTFIDTDFPEYFPIPIQEVSLTVFESQHYSLTDELSSYYAWQTLMPDGYAYVHLGPDQRLFAISMAHQLHCLGALRNAIIDPDKDKEFGTLGHSQHCLNYLRQWILCNPDLTLEPFDPLAKDYNIERLGATHVCRDWSAVYQGMTDNLKIYLRMLRDQANEI